MNQEISDAIEALRDAAIEYGHQLAARHPERVDAMLAAERTLRTLIDPTSVAPKQPDQAH